MKSLFTHFTPIAILVLSLAPSLAAQSAEGETAAAAGVGSSAEASDAGAADDNVAGFPDEQLDTFEDRQNPDPLEERANLGLVFGLKLGAGFSQPFSDLGSSFVTELEIGYLLPLPDPISRSIELFVTGQYAQPSVQGKTAEADPRLPDDGIMHYDVTQQQLILTFGALYRLPLGGELLRPYAALGGRVYMMRSQIQGEVAEERFGDNEETATQGGLYGALGCDVFLGPGSAFVEVQVAHAKLDGYVMRDTNVGALNLALGYRLFL